VLISEVLLGLKSKQGDVNTAFLHDDVDEGEDIFVYMPKSVEIGGNVLKLKKTLYGLRQSPCAFWKYLTEKLITCYLKQSKFDPCLFF